MTRINTTFVVRALLLAILLLLLLREFRGLSSLIDTPPVDQSPIVLSSWDPKINPLGIPPGKAQNLPSIRDQEEGLKKARRRYGGAGDKQHLGGFSEIDPGGLNPALFKHMIEDYGVHSFLDIGCGRGFSTSWFLMHGVDVLCAEGSHDAVERSVLPDPSTQVVEHDFSRGPWWPEKTYDVAWSVEFLEHVNLQYHYNYVTALRKAALIFVTSSNGAGWHHVEVHQSDWWIRKFESYGFKYSPELTEQVKGWARAGKKDYKGPGGVWLDGFYIRVTMKVFVNPVVAALPEHAHLFPEFGCFGGKDEAGVAIHRECNEENRETPLDKSMYPLKLTPEMDDEWNAWVEKHVKKN
jgi:SAM-dependent methyltransferase